jgi:hypothetical protein
MVDVPANVDQLSRKELQQLCKQCGIKANSKSTVLMQELNAYRAEHADIAEPESEQDLEAEQQIETVEAENAAAEEQGAKEAAEAQAAEEQATKETAAAQEAAEAQAKETAEAQATEAQAAKETAEAHAAEEQAAKETAAAQEAAEEQAANEAAEEQAAHEAAEAQAAQEAAEAQAAQEAAEEQAANEAAEEQAAQEAAEAQAANEAAEEQAAQEAAEEQADQEATEAQATQEAEAQASKKAEAQPAAQAEEEVAAVNEAAQDDEMETCEDSCEGFSAGDAMDTEETASTEAANRQAETSEDDESCEDKQGRLYESTMDELKRSMMNKLVEEKVEEAPQEVEEEASEVLEEALPEQAASEIVEAAAEIEQKVADETTGGVVDMEEAAEKSEVTSAIDKAAAFLQKLGGSSQIPKPRLSGGSNGVVSRAKQLQEDKKKQRVQRNRSAASSKSNIQMKGAVSKFGARPASAFEKKSAKKKPRVNFDVCHEKLFGKEKSIMDVYKRRQQTPKKVEGLNAAAPSTGAVSVPKLSFEAAGGSGKETSAAGRAKEKRDRMAAKARQAKAKKEADAKAKNQAEAAAKKEAAEKEAKRSLARKKMLGKNGTYEVKVGALAKFKDTTTKKDTPVMKGKRPKKFDLAASLAKEKGKKLGYKRYTGKVEGGAEIGSVRKSNTSKENVSTSSNPKATVGVKQRTKPAMKEQRRSQFALDAKKKASTARTKARSTPSKAPNHIGGALQTAK